MCELKSEGFFTMADKQKALDTALAQIEKQYGKGAIMRLGQNNGMNVASIPTGSISLDVATASAACHAVGLLKFTARNPPVNHPGAACHRPGSEGRGRSRIYRCGACA